MVLQAASLQQASCRSSQLATWSASWSRQTHDDALGHIFRSHLVASIPLLLPLLPAVTMNMTSTMSRTVPTARLQNQVPVPQQAKVGCIRQSHDPLLCTCGLLCANAQAGLWLQCQHTRCMSSQQCSSGSYTSSCCMSCCRPGCSWLERISSPLSRAGLAALQHPCTAATAGGLHGRQSCGRRPR